MGTLVSVEITAPGPSVAAEIMDEIWSEAERLEEIFSSYRPGSEVAGINREASGGPVRVSSEMAEVLSRAGEIGRMTDGAFDVTVGPLMRLWGFFPERTGAVPSESEVETALSRLGWRNVELDRDRRTVRFLKPGLEIDLAALAKGYIVDRLVLIASRRGVESGLINAGGDIYCLGRRPGGGSWRIGVENPREEGGVLAVLKLRDQAVATSGDYRNYFIRSRKRYPHIIDPRTGYPPASRVVEASVVAPDCLTADGLATAVFVLGVEKGLALLNELAGVEGVIVTEEAGKIEMRFSAGLPGS